MYGWLLHNLVEASFGPIHMYVIIWLLHDLDEASFDLFRYLPLGDQLKPWELHPLLYSYVDTPGHVCSEELTLDKPGSQAFCVC